MRKAPIYVLEGTWWSSHEQPLVLPYFHALSISHREIDVNHRTFRCLEDISFYVARIPKNSRALLYFASHGSNLCLMPVGGKCRIAQPDVVAALQSAKSNSIAFVHFGCCEMVDPGARRFSHQGVLDACGAKWASGYTKDVDWLQSMFIDLTLVAEIFVPYHRNPDGRTFKLKNKTIDFFTTYEKTARDLGFSALAQVSSGPLLLPERLHQ